MKYIRTKDGKIVELKPHKFYKYVLEDEKLYLSGKGKYLYINNVVSQADTIEELGDVYVIVPKDKKYKPYTENTLSVFDDITDVLRHSDIYLSIWVDALLKPIAKMSDKGELCLI